MSAHGKHRKRRRGCHKRAGSPEVVRWQDEHLLSDRPAWMERDTWRQLAALHRELSAERA